MKNVLITGISVGIGHALAQKFLKEGFFVFGTYLKGSVDISHTNLKSFALDLANKDSISRAISDIKGSAKNIDILINNAGILLDDEETKVIVDKLKQTLDVNLIGTIEFTEGIIDLMSSNSHIVNISSMAGSLSDADEQTTSHYPYHYPAYRISKCALNMYTRTLAMRMSHEDERNITVSSVHPGWVKTEIGGDEAPIMPEEAANDIYDLTTSSRETGQFWFKGKKIPW